VLQNFGLRSALWAFEQGGIFIVTHMLRHGTSVFWSHLEDRTIQSPFTTYKGMWRIYFNPDPAAQIISEIGEVNEKQPS
jgi:hypothetical protein